MKKKDNRTDRHQSFVETVLDKVRSLLDKYMSSYSDYEGLKDFMKDDANLYNPDGTLTEEYKKRIADVEKFVTSKPIDETLKANVITDDNDAEVLAGIIEFVERRKTALIEFTQQHDDLGQEFDAEEFVHELVSKNSSSEKEKKEIIEFMEEMAERDALEALDDDTVRQGFIKVINHKE